MSDAHAAFAAALADRYTVLEECGRGGTSIVYHALDLHRNQTVAIKVMRPELASASTAERFLREVRIAASLDHPRIARLLDSGEAAGLLYCVLPFIAGETLRGRIAREGPLPIDDALRLTREVGDALTYAHKRGVIHRDVKPENILLQDGHALLSDFGIARAIVVVAGDRVTDSGIVVGTPSYMSPEQATASAVLDARSDEYALAVCLYEMLAGDPPFMGRTSQAIIARQMSEPPPKLEIARPVVPPGVIGAIERALAKVPGDRYPTIADFLKALATGKTRLIRQRPWRAWAYAAAGAVVLVAAATWWKLGRQAPLDGSRVLVFPARTSASGSDASAGLRIADAIQVAVEHTEPLRWIPAWDDLDSATRTDPGTLQLARARDLALRRRARYFVMSATDMVDGRASVVLRLYDARGDSLITQASARDTSGGMMPSALAIHALPQLLTKMLDPAARLDLSPLTDRKPAAIVRLLEGEEAYRTARFAAAFDLYRQAVAEDSLFAYAALKGAQAASWQNRLGEAIDLVRVARARERMLPAKYRPYLRGMEAYLDGRADSAVAGFRRALDIDPTWAAAATALGDVYYHLLPSVAPLDSLAEAAFRDAFTIDSNFTPPLFHLAEIAVRRGDRVRAIAFMARLTRDGADASWTRHLAIMTRCLDGGPSPAEWARVAADAPDVAMLAARALAGGASQPRCAMAGFRAVLATPNVPVNTAWAATLGLHGLLAAQGRTADAVRLLDSARTTFGVLPLAFGVIDAYADSGFSAVARAAEAYGIERYGPNYERAGARPGWLFGMWEAWKGNRSALAAIAQRATAMANQPPATTPYPAAVSLAAASLSARAALLRGDTADALRRYAALPVVAPRDSISWGYFEPDAPDRLTFASLLLARGRPAEALAVASVFDHQEPVSFYAFVRPSLELRARAAEQLGRASLASSFRARLRALDLSR